MNYKKIFAPGIICLLALFSCSTTKNRLVIFDEQITANIQVNSSCRNSSVMPLKNEDQLKNLIHSSSSQSIKELKLKTNPALDKSTYKIYKIDFTINEICETKKENNTNSFRLHEELLLKNIVTNDLLSFKSDTLINNRALGTSNQLASRQINFSDYIPMLTTQNYFKAKLFFK